MEVYTLENLSVKEIEALRMGLDDLRIIGKEAMFIGLLQNKLSTQLKNIQEHISTSTSQPTKSKK